MHVGLRIGRQNKLISYVARVRWISRKLRAIYAVNSSEYMQLHHVQIPEKGNNTVLCITFTNSNISNSWQATSGRYCKILL